MSRIVRIIATITPREGISTIETIGNIVALSRTIDHEGAEPTGRKIEMNIELYKKIRLELQAHEVLSSYEIIASTQCTYLAVCGWRKK